MNRPFGVFPVFVLAIGQVTPPVGLCLFVACDIGKVSIEKISREVLPYVGGLFCHEFATISAGSKVHTCIFKLQKEIPNPYG